MWKVVVLCLVVLAGCGCSPEAAERAGPRPHAALHNVHPLTPGVISGAAPDGDPAFAALSAMGIRTIISVDGGRPDVERAKAHGLRYVHIPTTYATITDAQRLELARAVRDLPGPVYIHCHHGKHRGPAAAASAGVALGLISPAQGTEFMEAAGTAAAYKGLYASVRAACPATPHAIDSAPADFPPVRKAEGLVAAMVEIDHAFDHLGAVRAAGWTVPAEHPDLVPAAEAGRLADNLRTSLEDSRVASRGEDFARRLVEAVRVASDLERGLVDRAGPAELDRRFKLVQASCTECHVRYRDVD